MKKFICILLIAVFAFAAASCTETGKTDTTTDAKSTKPAETAAATDTEKAASTSAVTGTAETKAVINVPEVTLTYVAADVFVNEEAAESSGYKTASNMNLSLWFTGTITLEGGDFAAPEAFKLLDGYVLRMPVGKHVMEIDVFKVKQGADTSKILSLAQDRYNIVNGSDWALYDDEEGSNAKIINTVKIEQVGDFVVYVLTNDSEVSMLRAKKFVSENPGCSAAELYRAITCDIAE